jgi:hypothetical protein
MLLRSGSALGNNCGPLLVSKKNFSIEELKDQSISIPGKYTTANFLLNFAFPNLNNKTEKKGDLARKLVDIGKITTKLRRVRKLFPNNPITNKIIRPVGSLKSKAKRRKKNNENNENKDQG